MIIPPPNRKRGAVAVVILLALLALLLVLANANSRHVVNLNHELQRINERQAERWQSPANPTRVQGFFPAREPERRTTFALPNGAPASWTAPALWRFQALPKRWRATALPDAGARTGAPRGSWPASHSAGSGKLPA